MDVIAFASQKGGVGKTTLAGHLAVEAERAGAGPAALIDADPQHSLADWWQAREAETPLCAVVELGRLREDLERLRDGGVRLVIIDTPPAITASIARVIDVATLVVIPTRASPLDLRAVGRTVDQVEAAGKPLLFVINGAAPRARLTAAAAVELSQHGTVAPVTVYQRQDYAGAMTDGRTAPEIDPGGKAAQEIASLWAYVSQQLRRKALKAKGERAHV
jgi:chromosome partitioning protein